MLQGTYNAGNQNLAKDFHHGSPNSGDSNGYYYQGSRGAGGNSPAFQGQRYNTRNLNFAGPPLDASPLPPTNLYTGPQTAPTSYLTNRSSGPTATATDAGLQSIINHKFFHTNNVAPPTTPGPNACAFQYQPVTYSPYHAYSQLPFNQPQAVPE